MSKPVEAFPFWWTSSEWSRDKRTNTLAILKYGTASHKWSWRVYDGKGAILASGVQNSQKSARRRAREYVRALPDAEER